MARAARTRKTALPPEVERPFLAVQLAIAVFAFVGILTFPFPASAAGRSVVAVAVVAFALMVAVRATMRRWAAKQGGYRPAFVQTVIVPWEWCGDPGDERSSPIFGRMELPPALGLGPHRSRELGLPAPYGDVKYHQFFVWRPTVGRLTYRFQDGRASQAVRLVRGFNVVQLERADEPTGRQPEEHDGRPAS